MNANTMPSDAYNQLQHTAVANTLDEYLQRQSDCIRSLSGEAQCLYAIARDGTAALPVRFEALQILFWLFPDGLDAFLHDLCTFDDAPAVAEAARAVLFRSQIRR